MIRIKVDIDRLTLDEVIFLDDNVNRLPPRFIRQLLGKVLVDEQGAYIEPVEAEKIVGGLLLPEIRQAMADFRAQIRGLREDAVPPVNGSS